jgi:hypothetical protein
MMHFEVAQNLNVASNPMHAKNPSQATTVLEELFVLLEDYAPAWYTQEHHDRAVRALLDREN